MKSDAQKRKTAFKIKLAHDFIRYVKRFSTYRVGKTNARKKILDRVGLTRSGWFRLSKMKELKCGPADIICLGILKQNELDKFTSCSIFDFTEHLIDTVRVRYMATRSNRLSKDDADIKVYLPKIRRKAQYEKANK